MRFCLGMEPRSVGLLNGAGTPLPPPPPPRGDRLADPPALLVLIFMRIFNF